MMTLRQFLKGMDVLPTSTSWYLADLGESRGKQELFIRQSPQKLNILREHALIESAVSSNRIEGVTIDQKRVGTIIFGKPVLRDRNEEEIKGYRESLNWIHEKANEIPLSEETIKKLHRLTRGEIWDAGQFKSTDSDIIERYPDGRVRMRFKTVEAKKTELFMRELIEAWNRCLMEKLIHPLLAIAAFNLDFLCIHPFRDGNGRVSRLLMLLQLYHLDYQVGRYTSLERVIEQNKQRYYESLEQSSQGWHEGQHNPWHYLNFLLFIMKTAYKELEDRIEQTRTPRGAKTELILNAIENQISPFRISNIQQQCPGVSLDLIRQTLKRLKSKGQIKCLGRGQHARWQKTKKWEIGNTHFNR